MKDHDCLHNPGIGYQIKINRRKTMNKNNVHYNIEEKLDIMRQHLYCLDYILQDNFEGPLDNETSEIAQALDMFTFNQLKELITALKVISKGKNRCHGRT